MIRFTASGIYVPNINSDNVSVINRATNAVIDTIPVGTAPHVAGWGHSVAHNSLFGI